MTSIEHDIRTLVTALQKKIAKGHRDKYITHIRFPRFKNIAPDARIEFQFPVTAFVGSNGSGKTSALHALYGAPYGKSTSDFWFATDADPIEEGSGEPTRFIYGHWLQAAGMVVETRKARVSKSGDPDYWEPTKAVEVDNMETSVPKGKETVPGRSKDRWNPVARQVLYLNFRSELSAFDKYFFFGQLVRTPRLRTKQDRMRLGATRLKVALDDGKKDHTLFGKKAVIANRNLTNDELKSVCDILGKNYDEARIVRHSYYGNEDGVSVRFKTSRGAYTEAFAGSGELSIVSLVTQVFDANPDTLIILDEPEVSLHPGAQERLLKFLLEQSQKNHHQVVYSTHSPSLIRLLPENAIKVFAEGASGRFEVLNQTHPYAAFNRLGSPVPNKITVLVEDRLAKRVVDLAAKGLAEDERSLLTVDYLPGGASGYFAHRIPTIMHQANSQNTHVLLDGDQTPPTGVFPDPNTIPAAQDADLEAIIQDLTKCKNIALGADGGNDLGAATKAYALRRKYLAFLFSNVGFLPRTCPEEIVVRSVKSDAKPSTAQEAKQQLWQYITDNNLQETNSTETDTIAGYLLALRARDNTDLDQIRNNLRKFIKNLKNEE